MARRLIILALFFPENCGTNLDGKLEPDAKLKPDGTEELAHSPFSTPAPYLIKLQIILEKVHRCMLFCRQ